MGFAHNLKSFRESKGLNQRELAELTKLNHQNISRWELGQHYPNILQCITLANYFNISIDELVGREEKPTLEVKQDNEISEVIKTYKRLTERQKKQVRINMYTLLEDNENIEKEIRADLG